MWHKSSFIINETSNIIMKKKTVLFASCLLGTLAFSSCEKNLYDESKQPEKELQMKDLDIPADFQWKLTRVSETTVSSTIPTPTIVSFFLDEACSEEEKLATIPVYAKTSSLPLSIPTYAKTLYAQYKNGSGAMIKATMPINPDGSFSLSINDNNNTTSRAVTRGHDIEDDIDYDKGEGVIYHPKNGWGTIMFEDQFPSLGDYDFNDFVVNYKVQFEVNKQKNKDYKSKLIVIGLRLKAVGGIFPYSPYLRLKEIKKSEAEVEMIDAKTGRPFKVNCVENKKNYLIIDCSELIKNLPKGESQYFNTERGALVSTNDLPEIIITIDLNVAKEVEEILEDDEFDLYLKRNDDGTEIHMNGIEPVGYKYPFKDSNLLPVYESDGDEEDDNYYFSKERLIWGLRVPGNVAHAIEKANFLKAYPGFRKWATSSGKNEQNWYGQGNADKSLLIYN